MKSCEGNLQKCAANQYSIPIQTALPRRLAMLIFYAQNGKLVFPVGKEI